MDLADLALRHQASSVLSTQPPFPHPFPPPEKPSSNPRLDLRGEESLFPGLRLSDCQEATSVDVQMSEEEGTIERWHCPLPGWIKQG